MEQVKITDASGNQLSLADLRGPEGPDAPSLADPEHDHEH